MVDSTFIQGVFGPVQTFFCLGWQAMRALRQCPFMSAECCTTAVRLSPRKREDIFTAAGLDESDVSVLSEEFSAEVRGLSQRNLAVEALQRLPAADRDQLLSCVSSHSA